MLFRPKREEKYQWQNMRTFKKLMAGVMTMGIKGKKKIPLE
jgi:hypothetical protein